MAEDDDDGDDTEMEMSLIREIMARSSDRQLRRFWYLLTGVMRTRMTEDEMREAME